MVNDTVSAEVDGPALDSVDPGAKRAIRWIAGAAVLALLLRLPFVFTGLSTDEGGYAYVAQQWSRGEKLYSVAWLDRPQGLLLTYRAMLWVNDSGWMIRVGMMLAGALISVFLGVIGWQLAGRRVGVAAALIYAVVGVAPHLEGMTLNGELLASVPASASIAAVLLWRRATGLRNAVTIWWLLAAGLLAGVSMTMKQSGIDGILVGLAVVLLTSFTWRPVATFLAAFAVPIVACLLHGWYLGWSAYYTALLGYQLSAQGGSGENLGTRWGDFTHFLGGVALDLVAVVIIAAFGYRHLARFGRRTVVVWLVAGLIGVNLGGSYWPHYYMQPLPPLVLLGAVAVTSVSKENLRRGGAAVHVLPTLIWMAALVPMSQHHREKTVPYYALAVRDRHIAAAIDAETTADQRIYVLESEAYLYFLAQRRASYPYLWGKPIQKIASAVPLLRSMLSGADRPTLVIMDTPDPDEVDPTGGIRADLAQYYHLDRVVDGVTILRAD